MPDTALVLAPSGTDCELLLTGLALATGRTSVLHVASVAGKVSVAAMTSRVSMHARWSNLGIAASRIPTIS